MNEDALTEAGLQRIWKYSIMPLLTEHFYGKRGATKPFELSELRRGLGAKQEKATVEGLAGIEADEALGDSL